MQSTIWIKPAVLFLAFMIFGTIIYSQNSKGISVVGRTPKGEIKKRLALVIGNAEYKSAPLRNPVNDARSMSVTLRRLGFEVMALENAGQKEMKKAIDNFGNKLHAQGGVGLFYYSGHGMQVRGRNYMIPIGAEVKGEADVEYESVDAGRVLAKLDTAANGMNIVILDACRNNPYARSFRSSTSGLATMDAPTGTLIAYATAPGKVAADGEGSNGLYTEQLIQHMSRPGLKIEDVFKRVRSNVRKRSSGEQVPWEASSLEGDFYFAGVAAPKSPNTAIDPEEEYWKNIRESEKTETFEAFLKLYPNGRFSDLARLKIRQFEEKMKPAAPKKEVVRNLKEQLQYIAEKNFFSKFGFIKGNTFYDGLKSCRQIDELEFRCTSIPGYASGSSEGVQMELDLGDMESVEFDIIDGESSLARFNTYWASGTYVKIINEGFFSSDYLITCSKNIAGNPNMIDTCVTMKKEFARVLKLNR